MTTVLQDLPVKSRAAPWMEGLGVACLSFMFFSAVIVWMGNVHFGTMNGLWKSTLVEDWERAPATATLDPSNYLYFPMISTLCRGLDILGLHVGKAWLQIAYINAAFAAVNIGILFCFVCWLTHRRDAAWAAALLAASCGFFLTLATSNEDIMPTFTFVFAAMVLAGVWFAQPTIRQVVIVGVVFSIGWLGEWRLIFPTFPALILALALSKGTWKRRAILVFSLMAAMFGTAQAVALLLLSHFGAVGALDLFWTGKGLGTGYAGFSLDKLQLVAVGVGEYLLGGAQLSDVPNWSAKDWPLAFFLEVAFLICAGLVVWRRRDDPIMRTVAIVFFGTLAAGQVMNAYSQPQDPQMQINVMTWLPIFWGVVTASLMVVPVVRGGVLLLSIVPLIYNLTSFSHARGLDSAAQATLAELESRFDLSRTVFVYTGWEVIVAWEFVVWTRRWEGVCDLPPAPTLSPKFKWSSIIGPAVHHPEWSSAQHAASIKADLDCAFDKGYRVVAAGVWRESPESLSGLFTTLNSTGRGRALYELFNSPDYDVVDRGSTPIGDRYYEIMRKQKH